MATDISNIDLTAQVNLGIPEWLNFDQLRHDAIGYLGRVTGKIWTDYNEHDPGITTLEALIYGLLDLGYRTNLPLADILARDPAQKGKDPDFFTPGEVLGCNPLTLLDYRKLLLDIDGVRNAWVEVDTKAPLNLNGLYLVYIELDKELNGFTTQGEYDDYKDTVLCYIRHALMAHRNLCEDFYQVYFLCDLPVGVCADIELETGADVGAVYQTLITTLYEWFSPVPTYYTLQQMLARKVAIENIFAGRPYPGGASHGFLDTEELGAIVRRKEIDVSDVYREILGVDGVKRVRKIQLRICPDSGPGTLDENSWVLTLPDNTLPLFTISCGGFQFFKNGQPIAVDLSSYNALLELNLSKQGKVLFPAGSPYLDAAVPTGLFRPDLGDYYSIQHDFPQVYGIGEGSLPADAPPSRVALARQFKGFLLFFDQLLADYLAQLNHVRDLFALGPAADTADNHSYFIGDVSTVPDLDALLRFPGTGGVAVSGPVPGTPLAHPAAGEAWRPLSSKASISCKELATLMDYSYGTAGERDNVIDQLSLDMLYTSPVVKTVQITDTDRYIYVILVAGQDIVLVSRNDFADAVSAGQQAALVLFLGQDTENFSRMNTAQAGSYGFAINQSAKTYLQYLQTILEDDETYRQRRKGFLDHLLGRFAELFTDYALLYLGDINSAEFEQGQINAIERFLSHFPGLSADRGKATNYLKPGWNDNNISGLERRFKAYAGIDDWTRHHLCNFEVIKLEETFQIRLALQGRELFVSKSSFTKEEAEKALAALTSALSRPGSYQAVQPPEDYRFALDVHFYGGNIARSVLRYSSAEAARREAGVLAELFGPIPGREPDVRISGYEHHLVLLDYDGNVVRYSRQAYASPEEALAATPVNESAAKPQDNTVWEFDEGAPAIGALIRNKEEGKTRQFLVMGGFNISQDKNVPNRPGRHRFNVLDDQNVLGLHSIEDYEEEQDAWTACIRFLYGLAEEVTYAVRTDEEDRLRIVFRINDQEQAISDSDFPFETEREARDAAKGFVARARTFLFSIGTVPIPNRWRWHYFVGTSTDQLLHLASVAEYYSPSVAADAERLFAAGSRNWKLSEPGGPLQLTMSGEPPVAGELPVADELPVAGEPWAETGTAVEEESSLRTKMQSLVEWKQSINRLIDQDPALAAEMIVPDAKTQAGTWIYRLVDKDHPKARCPKGMGTKAGAETLRSDVILTARAGYPFLEICLGGDWMVKSSGTGTPVAPYFFQVKCRNNYFESRSIPDKDIILFESVQGYDSPEDAQAAFAAQYLQFLTKGMDAAEYSPGKWISLLERDTIEQQASPEGLVPQALVPQRTQQQLGILGKNPITELVLACQSYPIRLVTPPPEADPCAKPVPADPCNCVAPLTAPAPLYEFIQFNTSTGQTDWESIGRWDSPVTAMDEFHFFRMLLTYPGNLFIQQDENDCLYYVRIREVLAESAQSFPDPLAAWGANGVEKFIGVTQGPHGFHLQIRPENCGYTFWVGCPDCRLQHPCKYDTPQKRDAVRTRMHRSYQDFKDRDWLKGFYTQYEKKEGGEGEGDPGEGTLYGLDGQPLAIASTRRRQGGDPVLDTILDIIDASWLDGRYRQEKGGSSLVDDTGAVIARSAEPVQSLQEWKKGLRAFAQYFPLHRKMQQKGGVLHSQYRFAVKLPGFPELSDDPSHYMPCGCGPEPTPPGDCYVAWKNELVYDNAQEAWGNYIQAFGALDDLGAYQSVFDCSCGSYGIELAPASSIIAVNPQSYYLGDDACAAVQRAEGLINAEGLELVEHLLLRPCDEKTSIPACGDSSCPLPFVPGADPYSFIATVVLPGWPMRFAKPENRLQLEMILQREAPAHVLLRILWLCPRDLCTFEHLYKKWLYSLGPQGACPGFDLSAFINFLFSTPLCCWKTPSACCTEELPPPPSVPCWAVAAPVPVTQGSQDWLSEINLLYCWTDVECADTSGWGAKKALPATATETPGHSAESPGPEPGLAEPGPTAEAEPKKLNPMRLRGYRNRVQEMMGQFRKEGLVEKTAAFVNETDPSMQRFEKLAGELAERMKKAAKPTREKIMVLLNSMTGYWLDKSSLKEGGPISIDSFREMIARTGLAPGTADVLYQEWEKGMKE